MNVTRTILLPLAIVVTIMACAATVFGQDSQAANEAGIAAFQAGDFEAAAQHFANAAANSDDPLLRKNEALAWFKAGQCEPALEAANAFLLRWPKQDANREEGASVIANCKVEFARNAIDAGNFDLAQKLLFEADEFATDSYTRDRISTVRVRLSEARDKRRTVEQPLTPAPEPLSRTGFWLTASGGALLAAGVVYHLIALGSFVPGLEDASTSGDRDEYDRLAARVDTARWLVPVLYGIGATTTGIGVWLLVDESPGGTENSVNESEPRAQRWTAGFSYSASF